MSCGALDGGAIDDDGVGVDGALIPFCCVSWLAPVDCDGGWGDCCACCCGVVFCVCGD